MFGIIHFIPSVYNPHFTFFNIEQLEDFADKKITSSIVKLGTVGIIIPSLMIPCVLYLVDLINLLEVFIINISVLMVVLIVSIDRVHIIV